MLSDDRPRSHQRRVATEAALYALANARSDIRLHRFAGSTVAQQKLKPDQARTPGQDVRAGLHLRLFQAVAPLLPPAFTTTICVGLRDRVLPPFDLPVFGFQRAPREPTPLLPDIDMIGNDYYQDAQFRDDVEYGDKAPRAVFAGSRTGGMLDLQSARASRTPRLRAAEGEAPAQRVAGAGRTVNGAVIQEDADGWVGKPGGGESLAAFRLVTRPAGESFRLIYQASLDTGRFVPCAREGHWCGADEEKAALASMTIVFPRGARPTPFMLEARFSDGSMAISTSPGMACEAASGAAIRAFRVRLT